LTSSGILVPELVNAGEDSHGTVEEVSGMINIPGLHLGFDAWELEQKEFRRARSIFERALDVDPTSVVLWIRYISQAA
jgi:hypothetical protein